MKAKTRLTKAAVLEEVQALREKIKGYCQMSRYELEREYSIGYPTEPASLDSRESMIRALIIRATYHLTNVLDLE